MRQNVLYTEIVRQDCVVNAFVALIYSIPTIDILHRLEWFPFFRLSAYIGHRVGGMENFHWKYM